MFASEAALKSEPVKKELELAIYRNKRIIPVFEDIQDVRPILRHIKGVNIKDKTIAEIVDTLYHMIIGP